MTEIVETGPGVIIPQVVPDPPRRQYGLIVTATISLLGLLGLTAWFLGNLTDRNERLNHLVVSLQEEIGSLTRDLLELRRGPLPSVECPEGTTLSCVWVLFSDVEDGEPGLEPAVICRVN